MKEWKNPMVTNLGVEETKGCTSSSHPHTLKPSKPSASSDSSKDGSSSCSSDCPFGQES